MHYSISRWPRRHRLLLSVALVSVICASCTRTISYNYRGLPNPNGWAYRVQPGDVISVVVLRNQGPTGTYTVRPDGYITVPLAGELRANGLTPNQLRQALVSKFKRYIADAADVVSVSLQQVHGLRYSVIGEVQRAGIFDTPRYVTVLEALANAGGLTPYAQPDEIYVLRRTRGEADQSASAQRGAVSGPQPQRIPVSYAATIKSPGSRNFYLLSGDILVVP